MVTNHFLPSCLILSRPPLATLAGRARHYAATPQRDTGQNLPRNHRGYLICSLHGHPGGDEQSSVGSRARARTWDRPRNLSIFSCWSTTSPALTERRSWRCPEALQGVPAGLNTRVVLKRPTEVLDGFLASAQRLEDVASWCTLLARRCSRR